MGWITNVVNQKGGVGKTTTVASLGSALANRGLRTLLIDLDPDAYLSKWFSYRLPAGEPSSFDLFVGEGSPLELVRPVKLPGGDKTLGNLSIIPSSPDLQGLDIKLANEPGRETLLRDHVAPLLDQFDHILMDCPPGLGVSMSNALTAGHFVLIPVQTEAMAVEGFVNMRPTIQKITQRLNPGLRVLGILGTMHDPRTGQAKAIADQLRGQSKYPVFKTMIRRNVRLSEAPSFHVPIELHDPRSKGTEDYQNLAQEFVARINALRSMEQPTEATPAAGGEADPPAAASTSAA